MRERRRKVPTPLPDPAGAASDGFAPFADVRPQRQFALSHCRALKGIPRPAPASTTPLPARNERGFVIVSLSGSAGSNSVAKL